MASITHLRNAPITEAILDVRVRARANLRGTDFQPLVQLLKPAFPHVQERRGFTATLEIAPGKDVVSGTTQEPEAQGYFFWSEDRLDVAQFRIDGFSLNRLKPYQSWDEWFPRFTGLWGHYVAIARPESVTQVGVRCLNQFGLPSPPGDLHRFLTAPPLVPSGISLGLASFVTRLALADQGDASTGAHLTQALQIDEKGSRQVFLDVDTFKAGEFRTEQVESLFPPLHDLRNQLFFKSITDHTVELHR